jgi:hypothetical protein
MAAPARASRVMKARRESLCLLCWQPIRVGQQIGKAPIGWCHTSCIIDRALVTAPCRGLACGHDRL